MALSLLILLIVSMTSFNPVTSSDSSSLPSDSQPLLDFGFLRLIDDLISAYGNFTRSAMLAILAEIENQTEFLDGSDQLIMKIVRHGMTNPRSYIDSYYLGINDIDELYKLLQEYTWKESPNMERLKCFTRRFAPDPEPNIRTILWLLWHPLDPSDNLMNILIEYMDIKESFPDRNKEMITTNCCFRKQSQQYGIYEIYHKLVIFVVKAYTMLFYSIIFTMKEREPLTVFERKRYVNTIHCFQKAAVSAMASASRDILSCPLCPYQKGQKFIELKWLFNTIVTNEAYLNEDASCWKTCADYRDTTFHQYAPEPLDKLNICYGRIYNCFQQKVDSYCPATRNASRFDGLFPTKIGRMSCSKRHGASNKVSNGTFDVCEQCICYCDDYNREDTVRTFSLRAVESNTSENRVITGIQFVERNRMIYLRILEGKLKPHGIIEKSTIKWQPVHEFDYKSSSTSPDDFYTITYDKKFVNLDTLVAPAGQVLTGIKLSAQGSHLALAIKTHAFNYTTGILGNGSHFVTGKNGISRQEITMTAPDNPIRMNQSVVDTRENTYVTFRMTDLEKDAAQTAIPFIDVRPVISAPPVPLSGAGIYYSGQTEYGGFIGLKVVAYNLSEFIGNLKLNAVQQIENWDEDELIYC